MTDELHLPDLSNLSEEEQSKYVNGLLHNLDKIAVNFTGEAANTIRELALEYKTDAVTILGQAIATENFITSHLKQGDKLFIVKSDGEVREIVIKNLPSITPPQPQKKKKSWFDRLIAFLFD